MSRWIARFGLAGTMALVMLLSIRWASAQDNWIAPGSGNWSTPGNWSAGVPGSNSLAYITDSDGVSRIVTYDYTGPAVSLTVLAVDLTGGSGSATNTLSMSANNLTASFGEAVGNSGTGNFMQSGGLNTVNGDIYLGEFPGGKGSYTLSGTGSLSVNDTDGSSGHEYVGFNGSGNFTQNGGTNTINVTNFNGQGLILGYASGSTGTYNLSGIATQLTALNAAEYVGYGGTGNFTQNGGTNNSLALILGEAVGSNGSYTLGGTGVISVEDEQVGASGTGNFIQTGGSNTISSTVLSIGFGPNGKGTYTLSGGTVNTPYMYVGGSPNVFGPAGQGILNVGGNGTITISETLTVVNSVGTALNLTGGTINTGILELVGNPALLNWTGGTLNLTNSGMELDTSANNWNGVNSLTLNSGMALGVSGAESIGGSGTGSLTLSGGRNSVGVAGLSVGFGVGSNGTLTISGNGSLASEGGEGIGVNGTGVLNQSGGTNSPFSGAVSLGVNSGSSGTYTLSGGTLLSALNVYVGGSAFGPGGTGVLTVSGSGSIAFGGTITVYNTPGSGLNVNGGTVNAAALNLIGTYTHTAGNATYGHITGGGQMTASGGQVILTDDTSGHLTSVNVSGPATLGFDVGTSSNSQITADTATFIAAPTIALTLSGFPEGGSVFTLLSATHFNDNGNLSSLPSQAVTIGRDLLTPSLTGGSGAAGAIIVTVTGGPANLTWIGNNNIGFDTGGAWDTQTTNNWENHSHEALTPDVFYAGDHVTFDDTAANFMVDLNNGDVIANSVTFNNSANAYTVNGFNGIAGQGSVTFAGSKPVTLNNYNSYTGTTTISGGGLVSIGGSIASPTINVTHGTLQLAVSSALSGTPVVTLGNGTTTGVLDLAGTTNTVGGLSGGAGNRVTNTNPALATLNFAGGSSTFGGVIQDGNSSSGGGPLALNVANGALTIGGANTYSGGTTVNGGTLAVNGSILGDVAVDYGAILAGHGSVGGTVTVAFGGFLAPGAGPISTGNITLGSLTMSSGSQTNIKLAGTTPGSEYDQVAVTGSATLAGTLAVSLIGGFTPLVGETFEIFMGSTPAGAFDTLQLPNLTGALTWDTSQLYTTGMISVAGVGLPGDYNNNGVVDAADYVVWRANQGTTNVLANDPIGGTIGSAQYNQWRAHFGQSAGSGSGAIVSAAVPEPAMQVLILFAAVGWCVQRRRNT